MYPYQMQALNKALYPNLVKWVITILLFIFTSNIQSEKSITKQNIKALYIPLADHYAAIVAYEKYGTQMKHANFQIKQMKNWDLLRAYFQNNGADMAYVMSPLALDMYHEKAHFKWVGLMHRDGNALAINDFLLNKINLAKKRIDRKPDHQVANAIKIAHQNAQRSVEIALPHLLATHTVILYKYLKSNHISLTLKPNNQSQVLAIAIAPPKSPVFIKIKNRRSQAAAFEQSLPWADVVETGGFGHIAWYSKDVLPWENGHVECIALATNKAISAKFNATKEVMFYIQKAGKDIEQARLKGGEQLNEIVKIIRKHIPAHTKEAIIASLDSKLNVINYKNLNIDKEGLRIIMDIALEGGILKNKVDINEFSDERFNINLD